MTLHLEAVSDNLIQLLHRLMAAEPLQQFYLVGDTALALHYGHRKSIDLDLFTHTPFDASKLNEFLNQDFGLTEASIDTNTVLGQINGIKTDFIAHQYPIVGEVTTIDGVRLLGVEDIAAMKLNAIANRGSKKDFWDYAELLKHFDHQSLLDCYTQKYPHSSLWNLEKSLCYFDDAEHDPDPICLANQTWKQIKDIILAECRIH